MAKKGGKTPPKEFDELWDRVTANVDTDDIFDVDDVINKVHKEYPLATDKDADIYEELEPKVHEKVEENLEEWGDSNAPIEVDEDLDKELEDIILRAERTFSERGVARIRKEAAEAANSKTFDRLSGTGASKADIRKVMDRRFEKIPQAKKLREVLDINKTITTPREGTIMPEADRVKTFRRRGWYDDLLDLMKKPTSSYRMEDDLKSRGIGTSMKKGVLARRVRNVTNVLINQGYAERVENKLTRLTPEGRKLLKRIRK
jgi:hypothetical protein